MDEGTGATEVAGEPSATYEGAGYGYERSVRRLLRPLDRKVIGGVCAGLGDYFDVDPILFRVGFVVLTFFAGLGFLAYVLAWWIIPPAAATIPGVREPRRERALRRVKGSPAWVGVALVIVGAALLIGQLGAWNAGLGWGIALTALGVLLFRHTTQVAPERTAPAPVPLAQEPLGPAVAPPAPVPRAPVSRRRRERSSLGWITLGGALLAVGMAAILDSAGAVHVALVQYFALALAVLGAGLLVGAGWGRARWLIVPGVLLVPFVLTASLVDVPLTGGVGERVDRPATVAQVHGTYRLAAGQEILDLRQVAAAGRLLRITMTVGAGSLVVLVPPSAEVIVRGRVGGGEVELFGRRFDGVKVDVRRSFRPPAASGEIQLDLAAGFGQVKVSNDPSDVAGLGQGGA